MILNLPKRSKKPRNNGLTMVLDNGLPISLIKDYLELANEYIDYVKLGWGTGIITLNLEKKIELFEKYNIPISFGGTFFELCVIQNKLDEMISFLKDLGIEYLEISNGTIDISLKEKLKYIEKFSKDFKILSEVGSKDSEAVVAPKKWVNEIKNTLSAGSWKVILEGRESASAGMYRKSGEIRTGLIEEIIEEIDIDNLIFEAPTKNSQVWFIKQFGSNVNLGNIAFKDIIALETLRLGLRGDTLKDFHGN